MSATIASLLLALALTAQTPGAVVTDVRVHGNHTTPDAVVLEIAGVAPGSPFTPALPGVIADRLEKSGRFRDVTVEQRYRDLEMTEIALVIVVREPLYVSVDVPGAAAVLKPTRRVLGEPMFLPILDWADGYGFTYGLRTSFVDLAGDGSRLSIPATWGGHKQLALEFSQRFGSRAGSRLLAGAGWSRRENPHFEIDDSRREVWGRVEHAFLPFLRAGAGGGLTDVTFGALDERYPWVGADVTFDTRLDPDLPRNAVFARVGWERLSFDAGGVDRLRTDLRGYVPVFRRSVVAVRAQHARVSAPLPPFEQALVGGAGTLRGWPFGHQAGDNMAAGSIELRVPFSSPLNVGTLGATLFVDAAAAYDRGVTLGDVDFETGYGAGLFLTAALLRINLDVATDGRGDYRLHAGMGVRF